MTNDERNQNDQMTKPGGRTDWRKSEFVIPSLDIRNFSWRQSLDQPTTTRLSSVTKAIVQAIRATLPEFDHIRVHSITAPVRWERNAFVAEALRHLGQARIKKTAPIEKLDLRRCTGAQPTAQ